MTDLPGIVVTGASGRMGRMLIEAIAASDRMQLGQAIRARGLPSPTWDIADRVRALGLDGMLYASRSDPRLTHLTLFDWNSPGAFARVTRDGPPFDPDEVPPTG